MSDLKLKVCGMKSPENIAGLINYEPDFIGFIFYEKSPRFINDLDEEVTASLRDTIQKVGVFVNAPLDEILEKAKKYQLDYIQLHGDEGLELITSIKKEGLKVIKVFRIANELPLELAKFDEKVDYFLFDTDTKGFGGSGKHFDWNLLKSYEFKTPYLLSGGIQVEDIEKIKSLNLNGLMGVDVNSKFELSPGLKDLKKINQLKEIL